MINKVYSYYKFSNLNQIAIGFWVPGTKCEFWFLCFIEKSPDDVAYTNFAFILISLRALNSYFEQI
jgi:hypothetical protein